MTIKTISSRVAYENRWMTVREDAIERDDGSSGIFGVVEKPDFALVIPRDSDGGLYLVEQYRYPVRGRFLEFPQGSWDEVGDIDPAELARGELEEETGLRAGSVRYLGHLYEAYGYSNQGFHVFEATDLTPGPPRRSVEEQDMAVRPLSTAEFEALVKSGRIKDAPSIAAYGLLLLGSGSPASGGPLE